MVEIATLVAVGTLVVVSVGLFGVVWVVASTVDAVVTAAKTWVGP